MILNEQSNKMKWTLSVKNTHIETPKHAACMCTSIVKFGQDKDLLLGARTFERVWVYFTTL